jgi:hypothetical protein
MGLFQEAAARFVRTGWKSVQDLALEINAVFNSTNIDLSPRSITFNQPAGATDAPLVFNQPEGSTVAPIQINRGDTTIEIGGTGGTGGGGGGVDLGEIEGPGHPPAEAEDATPPSSLNPIPLHGVVIGKVGGTVYSVRCWARNPATHASIGILNVEFAGADPDDTIPNDTPCPVLMFPQILYNVVQPEKAFGYLPLFLEPEA